MILIDSPFVCTRRTGGLSCTDAMICSPEKSFTEPMIYPPPNHMRWVPEQPEVLHVARDRLVASMMEHDANRLLSQSLVRNRVVYDSTKFLISLLNSCRHSVLCLVWYVKKIQKLKK